MKKILFRTDAGDQIGAGHVMRCLAVAEEAAKQAVACVFVMNRGAEYLSSALLRHKAELEFLDVPSGSNEDRAATDRIAKQHCAEFVIVDGYAFDEGYLDAIVKAGNRLMAIDDTTRLSLYSCKIFLNQNPGSLETVAPQVTPGALLLLGPKYAMLRTVPGRPREISKTAMRLLVTLGGTDPQQLTEKVLEAIAQVKGTQFEIHVLAGWNSALLDRLQKKVVNVTGQHRLSVFGPVSNMAEQLEWADLSISASGSSVFDYAQSGLPAILIQTAENQVLIGAPFEKLGTVRYLGPYQGLDFGSLASEIERVALDFDLRKKMSDAGMRAVDGKGCERILAALKARANEAL